jgi:hypothetical protein
MADAYYQAIEAFAVRYQGDAGVVLGLVMAHEIGHLLLGPGHVPDGVMRSAWSRREMEAVRRRWLTFNQREAPRIRRELQARAAEGDVAVPGK